MAQNSQSNDPAPSSSPPVWSPIARAVASLLLVTYLGIVVLGPLTAPASSQHLTGPLVRVAAPVHRTLFLGHGYRFFAPEPGPGHFVECRFQLADGATETIHFPDRDQHWPRLLYHRWFMLAETLFTELDSTPDAGSFAAATAEIEQEAVQLQAEGKFEQRKALLQQRKQLEREYEIARTRIDELIESIAQYLLRQRPEAGSVELFMRERAIPLPADVLDGVKLSDERYLSEPISIGSFTREGSVAAEQGRAADAPVMEELP